MKVYQEEDLTFTHKFKHTYGFVLGIKFIGFDNLGRCWKVRESGCYRSNYTIQECEKNVKEGGWEKLW